MSRPFANSIRIMLGAVALGLLITEGAAAQTEGQDDLDKATTLKFKARSMADLERVVELGKSAIEKGLDKDSEVLASKLVTATLFQHGSKFAQAIFNPREQAQRPGMLKDFALRDFYTALEYDDSSVEIHMMIARLEAMAINGQRPNREAVEKGRKSAFRAVELAADDKSTLSKALVIRSNYQGFEDRFRDLDAAVEADPENVNALRSRGITRTLYGADLARQGKEEDAKSQMKLAVADLNKLLELNPDDPKMHEAVADLLSQLGKDDESLTHINSAIELNPQSPTPYRMRARLYRFKEEYGKAIADLDRAIDLKPDSYQLYLDRSEVHYDNGDKKSAADDYGRAKEMEPTLVSAILQRIRISSAQGKFKQAIDELQPLIKADDAAAEQSERQPQAGLRLQLGNLYVLAEKPSKAVDVFSTVLENTELAVPFKVQALRGRGDAYLSIGKQRESLDDYESAGELAPENDGILNNLAWVLATSPKDELRDGKRAIELATKACEVTGFEQAHILSTLAAAYAESGDFEKAKEWSAKAVEIDKTGMDQLKQELESYEQGKPWRELQETNEGDAPDTEGDEAAEPEAAEAEIEN